GVFGAAIAAGRLLELDVDGLIRALGIAGTMASGSLEYLSDGSWTKRLNPGWAAHSGIVAAHLASEGFVAPGSALEGRHGLSRGSAGLDDYTQANVDDPEIRALMSRTDCHRDPDLDAAYPDHWPATIDMRLQDGRELSVRISDPTGEPANPIRSQELRKKFLG